jgi:hypothetical protein
MLVDMKTREVTQVCSIQQEKGFREMGRGLMQGRTIVEF